LAEYGWCHRYEDSGSLFGLMRVRGMQMNDAHIYTTPEQAMKEFMDVIKLHEYYYKTLGIEKYEMELALRDPNKLDKYHGEEEDWKLAENMTLEAMKASGVPFKIANEGAAFYGPKMDFQIYSSIGRSFTASTNQLDLYMGKRFNLEYTDKDGIKKTPYIIHRAPLGTHERFIGFLIEHFAGAFPVWLSPVQVIVLPISEHQKEYADSIFEKLKETDIRVELDDSNESLGKRIRNAKMQKVPYLIVIGDKERDAKVITVEGRTEKLEGITIEDFIIKVNKEIKERILN
jgi:threonyl-tRNA synthetase